MNNSLLVFRLKLTVLSTPAMLYENLTWIIIFSRLYDTAIRLGKLQAEFKLQTTPEEYAQENLKFGLVEVVYEWAKVS